MTPTDIIKKHLAQVTEDCSQVKDAPICILIYGAIKEELKQILKEIEGGK